MLNKRVEKPRLRFASRMFFFFFFFFMGHASHLSLLIG